MCRSLLFFGLRPFFLVLLFPCCDFRPRLKQIRKPARVQALIPQFPVETFHLRVGVSRGLRRNVPVKHDDFALLILIIRGADMNLN